MVHHRLEIRLRIGRNQAIAVGGTHLLGHVGRFEQGLGGHAAALDAITAGAFPVQQRHAHPQLHGKARCRESSRTCPDDR